MRASSHSPAKKAEFFERLGRDPAMPPATVRALAEKARSPHTARAVLEMLAQCPDSAVLCSLATNPRLPRALFVALAASPDDEVLAALVANPALPPDLLVEIARRSSSAEIREQAQAQLAEWEASAEAEAEADR